MKQVVFCVLGGVAYEGYELLKVFSDKERANAFKEKCNQVANAEDWTKQYTFNGGQYDYIDIQKMEIDE
jgi:hypothetical protein